MQQEKHQIRFELDKFNMCVEGRRHPKCPTMTIKEGYAKSREMRASKRLIGGLKFEKNKNSAVQYEREVREGFHEIVDTIVDLLFEEVSAKETKVANEPDWDALLSSYTKRRNVDDELKYIEMLAEKGVLN